MFSCNYGPESHNYAKELSRSYFSVCYLASYKDFRITKSHNSMFLFIFSQFYTQTDKNNMKNDET